MKFYQKKWWRKLFKEQKSPKLDSEKDIQAVIDFLKDAKTDINKLLPDFKKLSLLEAERKVAASGIVHVNIQTQAKILDNLLEKYGFFQNDLMITAIRIKRIAENLLQEAKHQGMDTLASEKRDKWKLDW